MYDWDDKTNEELDELIQNRENLFSDALRELSRQLKLRAYKPEDLRYVQVERNRRKKIAEQAKNADILSKFSFKFTPSFSETFQTKLPEKLAIKNISKAMLSLGWIIVYNGTNTLEAKRYVNLGQETQKITASINNQSIEITSKSLQSNLCDFGQNSKRVGELRFVYEIFEAKYNDSEIENELKEIAEEEEKNKYQIPETLTKPPEEKKKKIELLIGGGLITSIILGGALALIASKIYVIFLMDVGIGIATSFAFGHLIRLSNISDFNKVKWFGFASVALTYFLSQTFRFLYIVNTNFIEDATLLDYFFAKLNNGLPISEGLNLGWIGLLAAWVVQVGIGLLTYYINIAQRINSYNLEKVPSDVIAFTVYLFNEGKTKDQIRIELTNKGWREKE